MAIDTSQSQAPTKVHVPPPTLTCGINTIKGLTADGTGSAYKPGDAIAIAEAGAIRNAGLHLEALACPSICKWKVGVGIRNEVWGTPTWNTKTVPYHAVTAHLMFDGIVECSPTSHSSG